MTLAQRFFRYFIGFAIGCLVVYFTFPNYDWFGWTPNKRVMQNIREARFTISPEAQCRMECMGINNEQLQLARKDGKVDFAKSEVKRDPKIYHLGYGDLTFFVELTDSTANLRDAIKQGVDCKCN